MWKLEIIGQQYYLNTQDAVYEVLTKTPEHILCERKDAVKIDLMIKSSQTAPVDEQYGVHLVPYRNVATDIIIDPNTQKNCPRNLALAIAYIAADKPDWTRFIPAGIKARELSREKHRREEIVAKQREPFQKKVKLQDNANEDGEEEEEEEFEICDNENNRHFFREIDGSTSGEDSDEDEQSTPTRYGFAKKGSTVDEKEDNDDDIDDKKLMVYNHETQEFVPATEEEEHEFDQNIGAILTNTNPPIDKKNAELSSIFGGSASQTKESMDELYARVAKVRNEQEQQMQEMLPSDLKRRQAAMLNNPNTETMLSELTQKNRSFIDLSLERDAAKAKECGLVENSTQKTNSNVLDRFAPQTAPPRPTVAGRPPTNPTQYTVQDLMKFGATTKLPPSIQQEIDKKKQEQVAATQQTLAPPLMSSQLSVVQPLVKPVPQTINTVDKATKVATKLKEIRRKHAELLLLYADLDDLMV